VKYSIHIGFAVLVDVTVGTVGENANALQNGIGSLFGEPFEASSL
jgi:hypothetical protein